MQRGNRGTMKAVYPWSAVVGQEPLKLALLLCAIDPSLGGVLISGPRGVAKTTLARALSELVTGRFVELPLGATEERVTGSLNLDRALADGRVEFAPGLLAAAHDGVLYVDEVNLLPDGLVDLLLDAAATGQNVVERDGVSHQHPARFVLVGSMNPEEGELRPQLIDRFGLAVQADPRVPPDQRAQIVTRRLEFDRDPERFRARFAIDQQALIDRCRRARERAVAIPLEGPALEHVVELCHAAGVEGVRADLAMLRAARARAAWHERDRITVDDVSAVAELALGHRRARRDSEPRGGSGGSSPGRAPSGEPGGTESGSGTGQRGAMRAQPVRAAAPRALPYELSSPAPRRRAGVFTRGTPEFDSPAGVRARDRAARGAIDWFGSLLAGRPLTREKLRYRARRRPAHELMIIAVDCSSSMLHHGGLSLAKSVAQALELIARKSGAQLALVSFRGRDARREASSVAGRAFVARTIESLGGGGGTPLRRALHEARALARGARFSGPGVRKRLVLLTDGRTTEPLADLVSLGREVEATLIDCERGRLRLGLARGMARALGAAYLHVDALPERASP
jgi:magnesium chelatase subunit D